MDFKKLIWNVILKSVVQKVNPEKWIWSDFQKLNLKSEICKINFVNWISKSKSQKVNFKEWNSNANFKKWILRSEYWKVEFQKVEFQKVNYKK